MSNVTLEHCLIATGFENAVTVVCHDCDVPLSLDMTGDRVPLSVSLKPHGKVREGGRDSGEGGGTYKSNLYCHYPYTTIDLLSTSLVPRPRGIRESGLVL